MWSSVLEWLPSSIRAVLAPLPAELSGKAEEIRIREGRPLEVVAGENYAFVTPHGSATHEPARAYHPTREDCFRLLDRVTNHSLYTMEEELKRGYITVQGGHRIGLAGRAIVEKGQVRTLKDIGGFNVRIAREVRGAAARLLPYLWDDRAAAMRHTLIVSPPGRGKTTLLRDLARLMATGGWRAPGASGAADRARKVGIVDERSEIAACVSGRPTFDVGARTDVLDGCPKAEGMMMMIRSMSPEILFADEIGRPEDTEAVLEALHAGITVIATAHGRDWDDVRRRPSLQRLFERKVFSRVVSLRGSGPTGAVASICDEEGRSVPFPSTWTAAKRS